MTGSSARVRAARPATRKFEPAASAIAAATCRHALRVGAVAAGQVRVEVGPQARRGVVGQVVPVEPGRVVQPVDHRPLTERREQLVVPARPGPGEHLHAQVAGQRQQQLAGDLPRRPRLVQRVQHHHQAGPLGRVKIPDSGKHILDRRVGGHRQRQRRCQRAGSTVGVQAAGPHRGGDPACCRDGGCVGQRGRAGCGDLGAQLRVAERAQPRQHRRLAGPRRAGHHPHRPARRAMLQPPGQLPQQRGPAGEIPARGGVLVHPARPRPPMLAQEPVGAQPPAHPRTQLRERRHHGLQRDREPAQHVLAPVPGDHQAHHGAGLGVEQAGAGEPLLDLVPVRDLRRQLQPVHRLPRDRRLAPHPAVEPRRVAVGSAGVPGHRARGPQRRRPRRRRRIAVQLQQRQVTVLPGQPSLRRHRRRDRLPAREAEPHHHRPRLRTDHVGAGQHPPATDPHPAPRRDASLHEPAIRPGHGRADTDLPAGPLRWSLRHG